MRQDLSETENFKEVIVHKLIKANIYGDKTYSHHNMNNFVKCYPDLCAQNSIEGETISSGDDAEECREGDP